MSARIFASLFFKFIMTTSSLTPAMQQHKLCKDQYPDCIIFFRLGDFYEVFDGDAMICSKILHITLTKRGETPMAGIPIRSVDKYIPLLLAHNHKIAIVEQVSTPTP
jgi:DNA mismatch repair protein MutS